MTSVHSPSDSEATGDDSDTGTTVEAWTALGDVKFVLRRRLVDQLDDRLRVRLTTIEAGAGFGKTTLLRQVLEHSEVVQQARDVVVRCRPVELGGGGAEVLGAIGEALGVAPTVVAIADGMLAASPDEVVLWIDDIHHLTDDARWLAMLVAELPGNGHLVFVGRSLPNIPMSRLEVQGQVSRITEDALRFDDDERAAFAYLRGRDLHSGADGWPALMELEMSVGRVGALDYLTEEVLSHVAADRRAALRRLARLGHFDDAMIREVTDFTGTATELVEGIPLVRIDTGDDGVTVIVMHDLILDALRAGETEADRSVNGAAVAGALLDRGDRVGAARQYGSIGDASGVAAVAEQAILDSNFGSDIRDRMEVVDIVHAALGDDVVALSLWALTAAIAEPAAALDAIPTALRAAREAGRSDLEARLLLSSCELAYSQSRVDDLETDSRRLADLAASGEPTAMRVAFVPDLYLRRVTERTHEIPPIVEGLIADGVLADDEMRAVALFYRTVSLAAIGRVREALDEAAVVGRQFPPGLFSDRIGGVTAVQRWMLGELDVDAIGEVVTLVDQIEQRGQMQLFVEGAATTAIFHATVGRVETARVLLSRAEIALEKLREHAWSHHTVAQAQAMIAVIDGDEERAARILDAAIPETGPVARLPSHVYLISAALSYVLVPRTREAWDRSLVLPDAELRTQVGVALVAFRESGDTSLAAALPWDEPYRIRPWLVEPHLVELAVAAIADGATVAAAAVSDLHVDPFPVLDRLATDASPAVRKAVRHTIKLSPRRPGAVLALGVLGPLSVVRDGAEEADLAMWRRARVSDLLLLLVHHRKISREQAAQALWPDKPRDAGLNNLRVNLSHLLKALEPDRAGSAPSWFVRADGNMLRLDSSEALTIDVDRFRSHVAKGRSLDTSSPRLALPEYLAACELYRGDYLEGTSLEDGWYYDALHLRGEFVSTATRAADLLLSMGEFDRAESLSIAASGAEPLNESAMRVLAASLLAQRRIGAAGEVLRTLLHHLAEVQIPPEPETRRLAARLSIGAA